MVSTGEKSVTTASALMQEALDILDSCEALVPAVHLWTALQALNAIIDQGDVTRHEAGHGLGQSAG